MVNFPEQFSKEYLQLWYNDHFKSDVKLSDEIQKHQEKTLKYFITEPSSIKESNERNCWGELFNCVNSVLESKKLHNDIITLVFEPNVLPKNEAEFRDNFIKGIDSVLNKYWRKIKQLLEEEKAAITFTDFLNTINDFIRFSIKANTLRIAEDFAKEIEQIPKLNANPVVKNFFETYLEDVTVDHELKMASGYFAYHCYFHFKEGFIVEMQIFSELSNYWRKLSHHIYEQLRDKPKEQFRYNDVESRMIAMGHLLYLADCELNNIESDLGLNKK